jgi:LPS O-antigen subunit length determinant protein (WzzB/FepE family)
VALKVDTADFERYETTPKAPRPPEHSSVDLYMMLLRDYRTIITVVTLLVVAGTFIYTKWVATKWYLATAVIAPVAEGAVENRVEGGIGSLATGGMASLLMQSGNDAQAQEYMTILRSFAFNTDLAIHHDLVTDLLGDDPDDKPKNERALRMKLFDVLENRFSVDYSIHAQSLSVHFEDRDPLVAQQILQYYLDDLRDIRRHEAIRSATAAIASLEKEARQTGDSLLSQQLYGLVARQVQRQKLAEVESDFAFKVLEPPISPDKQDWPRARINCFIALLLTPMLLAISIVLYHRYSGRTVPARQIVNGAARPNRNSEHNGAF